MAILGTSLLALTALTGTGDSRSTDKEGSTARIVDLISEGPVVGLANNENPSKSIFINDVPIVGSDDRFNYDGVKWSFLTGTEAQRAPTGFGSVASTTPVGREVEKNKPVVIRVRGRNVDAVRLALRFPAMFEQKDDGSTIAASAQLQFEAKVISATEYIDVGKAYVSRKSTSAFERNYRIDLSTLRTHDPLGSIDEDVDIRVSRLDAKSTSLKINSDSFLASYTSILDAPIAYANSAICAMAIDVDAFANNASRRTYDVVGLQVEVPSNYIATSHSYTRSVWDGLFKPVLEWSDNPVWLLYALLTNPRYGLGMKPEQVDKMSFYEAAVYNDEKVPNGEGGTEPRYTWNASLNTRRGVQATLKLVASNFQAKLLWVGGKVSVIQDRPKPISAIVSKSSVADGAFTYTGVGISARHSSVKVNWINPDDNWQPNDEIVENNKLAQQIGNRELSLNGYGIKTRGQARRKAYWALHTELNEKEVVSYVAGLSQVAYRPGDIIAIADDTLNEDYGGGRIMEVNDSSTGEKTLKFDRGGPALQTGNVVWIATNNAANPILYVRLTRHIDADTNHWAIRGLVPTTFSTFASITGKQVRFVDMQRTPWRRTRLDFIPGAEWATFDETEQAEPRLWNILSVKETTPGQVKVEALEYYPTKHFLVDSLSSNFRQAEPTRFQLQPPSIIGVDAATITLTPYIYRVGDVVQESATLSWEPIVDARILYYRAEYSATRVPRMGGDIGFIYDWQSLGTTSGSSLIITNFEQNPYFIRISWISNDRDGGDEADNRRGPYSSVREFAPATFDVAYTDVENFKARHSNGILYLTWDALPAVLLSHYEIRHSIENLGWESATTVDGGTVLPGTFFDTAAANGFYYIRAFDKAGNESENPTVLRNTIVSIPDADVAAVYIRPSTAATQADRDNIAKIERLESLGADNQIQISGTEISPWRNTESRLYRDPNNSYFNRPGTNFDADDFSTTTTDPDTGLPVRDYTPAWYPRQGRASRVFAYDKDGTTRRNPNETPSDELESTNSESIDGVLYSEPLATVMNWATMDFTDSILVHKDDAGTEDYPISGRDSLESRDVKRDNAIGFEVRRSIQSKVAAFPGENYTGGNGLLFLKDYLYKAGFDPTLDANVALRRSRGIEPGLLVSKNTRPEALQAGFQERLDSTDLLANLGDPLSIQAFGDRRFEETQWYESSENLMPIGNIGYNRTTRIFFPAIDFGEAVKFNFTAEIDWYAELADKLTDYQNRIPDRIDFTNTDNTFNAALPTGGSGGQRIQHVNGVYLSQSPDALNSNNNQLALANLINDASLLTLKMRYINTADKIEFLDSDFTAVNPLDEFRRGVRTGQVENGLGETPTTGQITLAETAAPNLFTSEGVQTASIVWAMVEINRPSGIYTEECSLYRDVVKSIKLRFDLADRVVARKGVIYDPTIDTTPGNWLTVNYTPAFIRAPALVIDPENLAANEEKQTRNQTNKGFDIRFVDTTTGNRIGKSFSFVADGFGFEVEGTTERLFNDEIAR